MICEEKSLSESNYQITAWCWQSNPTSCEQLKKLRAHARNQERERVTAPCCPVVVTQQYIPPVLRDRQVYLPQRKKEYEIPSVLCENSSALADWSLRQEASRCSSCPRSRRETWHRHVGRHTHKKLGHNQFAQNHSTITTCTSVFILPSWP